MKVLFNQLNYSVSETPASGKLLKIVILDNPDGTPRWICRADETTPYFLKFYNINNLRSACFAAFIKMVFFFRLQTLIFKTLEIYLEPKGEHQLVDLFSKHWAIFTGTTGPNRKILIYSKTPTGDSFYKIGTTAAAVELLRKEANALSDMAILTPHSFTVPQLIHSDLKAIQLEDISENTSRVNTLGTAHFNFISEMYYKTYHTSTAHRLIKEHNLFSKLGDVNVMQDERIPQGIVRKLFLLLNATKNEEVELAMSHGDFTPWNCFVKHGKLAIYDWEMSDFSAPVGFDAFHFIMQKGILTERKSWKEIRLELNKTMNEKNFFKMFKSDALTFNKYLQHYLVFNVVNYLKIYSQQDNWHPQIHWLINTWNDALTDLLQEVKCHRELLIMDLFDFLNAKNYATIKFPEILPENLSEYSDIDMCIQKQDWYAIHKFFMSHPLIEHCKVIHKSFMNTVHIVLKNGKFLSIDFLWEIKRKSMVMLDTEKVLSDSYTNAYGVKVMAKKDIARYISLFYGLNNAAIPYKYRYYNQMMEVSDDELDRAIFEGNSINKPATENLQSLLKMQSFNSPLKSIRNKVLYIVDSVRQLIFNKGFIITFSGVDGAGKSTIIELTKKEIEKKLRRKVVVLRHRPSMLPILSAFTKGKAKAELEASQKLPRQGSNLGKLSSLLRFSYYFTDYIFGQFYVYLKYTRRGTVVLYDRYYFDFIVDSRRSNISISDKFVKFCYRLLMKPDLNFFLYADAGTILKRKQELSAATIKELTQRYRTLFTELNFTAKGTNNKYFSIRKQRPQHNHIKHH